MTTNDLVRTIKGLLVVIRKQRDEIERLQLLNESLMDELWNEGNNSWK